MAFRDLREEVLELFEEEAPARLELNRKGRVSETRGSTKTKLHLGLRFFQPSFIWNAENPESCAMHQRDYRRTNKARIKERNALWKAENPEKVAEARKREYAARKEKRKADAEHKAKAAAYQRERYRKLKCGVVRAYARQAAAK